MNQQIKQKPMSKNDEMSPGMRKALQEMETDIADLTAENEQNTRDIDRLTRIRGELQELYGDEESCVQKPKRKARQNPAARVPRSAGAPATGTAGDLDKPDTLSGAMKQIVRGFKGTFTSGAVRTALQGDKDFIKLLEDCGASALPSNLNYWAKTGKLKKTGEGDEAIYELVGEL